VNYEGCCYGIRDQVLERLRYDRTWWNVSNEFYDGNGIMKIANKGVMGY
jgi:hypothetical protein